MSIDSLFKEYDDPNLILNDSAFSEFDRMLKVEEYKLLMLLRKIKDTPIVDSNDNSITPAANQIANASTILKDEFANVNILVMAPNLAKEIVITHLKILMQSLN